MSNSTSPKKPRGWVIAATASAVLIGLLAGGTFLAYDQIRGFIAQFQVEDYEGEGGPVTTIVIAAGDDGAAVASNQEF